MTPTRVAVVVAAWLAVLGAAGGLTVALLAAGHDPKPILDYDAGQLVSSVPVEPAPDAAPGRSGTAPGVDPGWVERTASATGLPPPAIRAYATASLRLSVDQPSCGLGWSTLAGIGEVESEHGTVGGRTLLADGHPSQPIIGPALDGQGPVARIRATGAGTELHRDPTWDHAVGPLQFLPSTWAQWRSDGDGDGVADPQDLDDAAYAAARYLCAGGGDLTKGPDWAAAVFSYNHAASYVEAVYAAALRLSAG